MPDAARRLATVQHQVLTAAQLAAFGLDVSWGPRRVRAGHWQRLHRGVYVVHSGPVDWFSRAHAALLYAGPGAALSHRSAAFAQRIVRDAPSVIDVSVPADRRVMPSPGLRIRLRRAMPPTTRGLATVGRADTVLDILQDLRSVDDAVGLICAAVRAGATPQQVVDAMSRRPRVRHRGLVSELLAEVAEGIESPLERRYQHDVERRHALPPSRLQVRHRVGGRWIRADRVHPGLGTRIELDGEVAHPGGRTDADVWRDNAVVLATAELTLRFRWRHVRGTPCAAAAQVVTALRAGGWTGRPRPCGPLCAIAHPQRRAPT